MAALDGSFSRVSQAIKWSINEFLSDTEEDTYLFECNFDNSKTFELYQDPAVGWLTKDSQKLGSRAQKLTFRFNYENKPYSIELQSYQGSSPLSLTAIKTVLMMNKILTECMLFHEEVSCAQPSGSPSDWNFPKVGGYVRAGFLAHLKMSQIKEFWQQISPDLGGDFAVGRPHTGEELCEYRTNFTAGDLVVVKRSDLSHTFAKVIEASELQVKVMVRFTNQPKYLGKTYTREEIAANILGRWSVKKNEPPSSLKRSTSSMRDAGDSQTELRVAKLIKLDGEKPDRNKH